MSRSVALACCAVLLMAASASAAKTASEINLPYGLKAQCNFSATSNPDPGVNPLVVLSVADCQTCVGVVANQIIDNRTHGCWSVCQRSADPSTGKPIIDTAAKAPACKNCIQNEGSTVEGCKACLMLPAADFAACITRISDPAPTGLPWYRNTEYELAVAKCFTLPVGGVNDGTVRQDCLTCINSADAKVLNDGGFMNPEEAPKAGQPARPNDFAACFWRFNQTWNLVNNIAEAEGVYDLCNTAENKWGLDEFLTPQGCGSCMVNAALNPSEFGPDPAGNKWIVNREPFCAQLCIVQSNSSAIATDCVNCVTGYSSGGGVLPKSPSSCSYCMIDTFLQVQRTECMQCLSAGDKNYKSKTSNYDWACGKCAAETNPVLRSLCFACIQSQEGAADGAIDKTTEASICQCVDLTYKGFAVNDFVSELELSCFANYTSGVNNTAGYVNEIPFWGRPQTITASTKNTDYPCVQCVTQTNRDNKYACHEVCQDNSLITTVAAGDKCKTCLTNNINTGSDCKACLKASSDDSVGGKRDKCYSCIAKQGLPASDSASYLMACATCSEFNNENVWKSCYNCLNTQYPNAPYTRAWECINAVRNGTFTNPGFTNPGLNVNLLIDVGVLSA